MEKELYEQMLNLPTLKVDKVEFTDKTIRINCHLDTVTGQCPTCLESVNIVKSYRTHTVRDLNISGREVYLELRLKQFYCSICDTYFTQSIPFADANKSYTHRQQNGYLK